MTWPVGQKAWPGGRPRGNPGWQKGQSGNPGGRPRKDDLRHKAVHELAQRNGVKAIRALIASLADPDKRVSAAVALLDRGFGRPKQAVEMDAQVKQIIGGIDAPAGAPQTPEQVEEWLARKRAELAELKKVH